MLRLLSEPKSLLRKSTNQIFPAMKIQISDHCKDLLESVGGFLIQERGTVDVKVQPKFLFAGNVGHVINRFCTDKIPSNREKD